MSWSNQPAGNTVKGTVSVTFTPPAVAVTNPVVAPTGTVATICVLPQLVTAAEVPLNATVPCAVPKFAPVMVTCVPANPEGGDTVEMTALVAGSQNTPLITAFQPEVQVTLIWTWPEIFQAT